MILTGMFGLDTEHNMKSELHPLYAMATLRDTFENQPGDQVWLMFVRNQGDEGYCSSQIWDAGFEDYTFRLPWRAGVLSVDVNWEKTEFVGTDGTSGPVVSAVPPPSPAAGVYVSFHLGPAVNASGLGTPASVPSINGGLHLAWSASRVGHPVATTRIGEAAAERAGPAGHPVTGLPQRGAPAARETDDIERQVREAIDRLPAQQKTQVEKAHLPVGAKTVAMHRLAATGPVRMLAQPPAVARRARPHAIKAGPAAQKNARDAAQLRALCAVTNNAPAGLPPETCTAGARTNRNVRDHR